MLGCDTSKTTILLGEIRSGLSPEDARRTVSASEDKWKVIENSHLPPGDKRPRFDILQVEVPEFTDCGVKGVLALHFFNGRLTSTWFYPSDLSMYLQCLESRHIHFDPKGPMTQTERNLGATIAEVRVSHRTRVWLFRDYRNHDYVGWEDIKLIAEENQWIRNYL